MKFYARFAYYFFGFLIGIFFVALMWSKKGLSCNYLPNSRVLNDIRQKPFHYSPAADSAVKNGIVSVDEIKIILTDGSVDFSQSNKPEDHGKVYVVTGETAKKQDVTLRVINYSDRVLLKSVTSKSAE